ncbi:cell wall-binding repeat-containing protein [Microbacterium invictum]|uniref:Cell wall-binding protein n=1 Tax=Microbacterium invictum TaxID=515415 RepID=A0AA40VNH8_9MICO|nr:cell wall-binding repeat-containing protein [Microbacterium invictum]MBB4141389.1 putative cell wall-binding protein [Microbacterium invictum]
MRARLSMVAGLSLIISGLVVGAPATAATTTAADLPALLRVAAETTSPTYERAKFEHWIDADRDGCNTRYEVLIEESTTPTTLHSGCKLDGGTWVSAMDGTVAYSTDDIEIDHHVALAEAWRSGASGWTDAQRRDFANDLDVPYALNSSSTASNQSKGDKDPAKWMPTNSAYRCEYATSWALVKYRWSLAVDSAELTALKSLLSGSCGATPVTRPSVALKSGSAPTTPTTTTPAVTTPSNGISRLAGIDRYATAIQVSRQYAAGVSTVYVATGANFPDALSAAAAAALVDGPLLLTPSAALPSAVAAEITRLKPATIAVVGGTGAVSAKVADALRKLAPTQRLGKSDRYATGLHIVDSAFTSASTAFIATGRTFPDALAATGAAGALGAPVILVDGVQPKVSAATLSSLKRMGVNEVVIAGGTGAVSAGIESQLKKSYRVTRVGGADRYETAARINNRYFPASSSDTLFLATGLNFPDALAGAALAGTLRAPMYVTAPTCVPDSARASVADFGAAKTVVLGGTAVVSDSAAKNFGCLASAAPTISGTAKVGNALTARVGTWTSGTTHRFQWYANGAAISGATGQSFTLTAAQKGKKVTVAVTGSKSGYTTVTRRSKATAAVAAPAVAPKPDRTTPISKNTCPSWAPIKGNESSMIYHVKGGQYYDRTNPEECFTTQAAARAAGYRASMR